MPVHVSSTSVRSVMPGRTITLHRTAPGLFRVAWSLLLGTCLIYAGFALSVLVLEAVRLVENQDAASPRTLPPLFIIHALAGSLALVAGPLQMSPGLRTRKPAWHRAVGRIYVIGVCACSFSSLPVALAFSGGLPAKAAFLMLLALWLGSTLAGAFMIKKSIPSLHREWMLRSFALCLFFVTFSLWDPALATVFPGDIAFPLAVTLGWLPNLLVAEYWIHRTRVRTVGR